MANITQIIDEINKNTYGVNSTRFFQDVITDRIVKYNLKTLSGAIITNCTNLQPKPPKSNNGITVRETLSFTNLPKVQKRRDEEILERLIVYANNNDPTNPKANRMANQVNCGIGGKKENIDIMDANQARVTKNVLSPEWICELKTGDSQDNPLYAAVEILKNYMLPKRCSSPIVTHPKPTGSKFDVGSVDTDSIKKLIVLAPKKYYDGTWHCTNNTGFKDFSIALNTSLSAIKQGLKIEFKYFDLDWQAIEVALAEELKETGKARVKSDAKKLYDRLSKTIVNNLLYGNWKDVV